MQGTLADQGGRERTGDGRHGRGKTARRSGFPLRRCSVTGWRILDSMTSTPGPGRGLGRRGLTVPSASYWRLKAPGPEVLTRLRPSGAEAGVGLDSGRDGWPAQPPGRVLPAPPRTPGAPLPPSGSLPGQPALPGSPPGAGDQFPPGRGPSRPAGRAVGPLRRPGLRRGRHPPQAPSRSLPGRRPGPGGRPRRLPGGGERPRRHPKRPGRRRHLLRAHLDWAPNI